MASSSVSRPSLAFGMEIELLVKPKGPLMPFMTAYGWDQAVTFETNDDDPRKARNRASLRAAIAQVLTVRTVKTGVNIGEYKDWTVVDERSLDELPGFCM